MGLSGTKKYDLRCRITQPENQPLAIASASQLNPKVAFHDA
jgi:hypothetical protein